MMTQLHKRLSIEEKGIHPQASVDILKAISTLVHTYATAQRDSERYARYGYQFPEMIKTKLLSLNELSSSQPWIDTFSGLMIESLDSPEELVKICNTYLIEQCHKRSIVASRKEFRHAHKAQTA